MFTVEAHGIPAHAGLEPEKGASAILEIAKQISKLNELNNVEAGTTVNVCTVRGGTTTNVIPEHAECAVDVRFTSVDEARRIERSIHELQALRSTCLARDKRRDKSSATRENGGSRRIVREGQVAGG
jgi:glutamate carboxypeptidase